MLYATKFDMFEMLKVRCLNLCMDIYSDVGKFLKTVFDDQDKLFKLVSCIAQSIKNSLFLLPASSSTKNKKTTMNDIIINSSLSIQSSTKMPSCKRNSKECENRKTNLSLKSAN